MRRAYCTGCNTMFNGHHFLMNHRNTERCGGRFLSLEAHSWLFDLKAAGRSLAEWQPDETEYVYKINQVRKPQHKARVPGTPKPYPKHMKLGARRKAQERFKLKGLLTCLHRKITHPRAS